jgi:membrane protein DedA with SNARE-associated domain
VEELSREELRRRRRTLQLLLGPLILSFVARSVGVALAPALLERAPVALALLSPLSRHLVLISPALDGVTFFVAAVVGMFWPDPFAYLLGRQYGGAAVDWIERRAGSIAPGVRWLERLFQRAAPLVLFVTPGPFVNLLAGASQMRVPLWLALNLAGTATMVLLLRLFGDVFAQPIAVVRAFIEANVALLTVLSVMLVIVSALIRRRRMRRIARETQRVDEVL